VTGSGPGILLAHGAGGSVEPTFGGALPALAAAHTVVGPDYPGAGATPRAAEPLTLDALADSVVAAALAAGVETFTVLGFSLGAAVAVRAATRHPDRVRGLVLTAGLARADNRVRLTMDIWKDGMERGDRPAFSRFLTLTGLSETFLNALPPAGPGGLEEVVADGAAGLEPGTADHAAVVRAVDLTAELPHLRVPVLVINATEDDIIPPAQSRRLAAAIPGAEYAELATGHVVMAEQPERWQSLIMDFLARHGL
jgi:pimeloyl-ACP methyl ester carboxylesterase